MRQKTLELLALVHEPADMLTQVVRVEDGRAVGSLLLRQIQGLPPVVFDLVGGEHAFQQQEALPVQLPFLIGRKLDRAAS